MGPLGAFRALEAGTKRHIIRTRSRHPHHPVLRFSAHHATTARWSDVRDGDRRELVVFLRNCRRILLLLSKHRSPAPKDLCIASVFEYDRESVRFVDKEKGVELPLAMQRKNPKSISLPLRPPRLPLLPSFPSLKRGVVSRDLTNLADLTTKPVRAHFIVRVRAHSLTVLHPSEVHVWLLKHTRDKAYGLATHLRGGGCWLLDEFKAGGPPTRAL